MSRKIYSSTILAAALLPSLWSATSMAQGAYGPPPGYYPPPPASAPVAYSPQAYPRQAYAQPAMPGYQQHDGFYLRALVGLGYLHASASYNGQSITESGPGVTLGIALGGVVAPNLVLYGEFLGTMVTDPHYDDGTSSGTYNGVTETLASIGPGLAYYLDGNMYLSGTLLLSKISYSDSNDSSNAVDGTNFGVGLGLTFGKEWWVTYDWGLGLAGQLSMSSMKDAHVDARWTGITAALLFSATYN